MVKAKFTIEQVQQLITDQELYRQRAGEYVARLLTATTGFSEGLRVPRKVTPGSYLFFNQVTRLAIRGQDLGLMLQRLFTNREQMRRLDIEAQQLPVVIGQGLPGWEERQRLHQIIRVDFESLYIFGNAALDLWAAVTGFSRWRVERADVRCDSRFRGRARQGSGSLAFSP